MSNGDTGSEGITDVQGAAKALTQCRYLGRTISRTDIKYNNTIGQSFALTVRHYVEPIAHFK